MKFDAHNVAVKMLVEETQTRGSFSGLNYRGPSQYLKSLQTDASQCSRRAMIDLLATDLSLEDVFTDKARPRAACLV